MLRVLSTKQLNAGLIDKAQQMGITLTCFDLISIYSIRFDASAFSSMIYDAVVFTSSNAVKHFFENEHIDVTHWTKPVYALSGKTTDELTKLGLTPAAVAGNADELSAAIIAKNNIRVILHICGNLALDILETRLLMSGISYVSLEVYETVLIPITISENYDAVMFYSPSGIESFTIKNELDPDALYCCIGETTASKLKNINGEIDIILPKQPSPEGMLTAIRDFKNKVLHERIKK